MPAPGLDALEQRLGFVPSALEAFSSLAGKMYHYFHPGYLEAGPRTNPYAEFLDSIDVPGRLERAASEGVLLRIVSTCVLQELFKPAGGPATCAWGQFVASAFANRGDVEADEVQGQAHAGDDCGGELLPALAGKAREMHRQDRRSNECVQVRWIRRAFLQPATDRGEAGAPQPLLGLLRTGKAQGDQPARSGARSRKTESMTSRTRAILPAPPHCTSSRPPGRSAPASRAHSRS